jgi:hypothetical protein
LLRMTDTMTFPPETPCITTSMLSSILIMVSVPYVSYVQKYIYTQVVLFCDILDIKLPASSGILSCTAGVGCWVSSRK